MSACINGTYKRILGHIITYFTFCAGCSRVNHILTLTQLTEKRDVTEAYHTVSVTCAQ